MRLQRVGGKIPTRPVSLCVLQAHLKGVLFRSARSQLLALALEM